MTYTDVFGGQNVNPANLSYVAYTVSGNLQLVWAFEAVQGDNATADKIDISNTTVPSGLLVFMPPADQVSVGQDVLFGNVGTQPFSVVDNGGNLICTIQPGLEWFIFVTDNDTVDGIWRSVQFGASTSAANAAALAGAGLRANISVLDQNLITQAKISDYTIVAGDRATVVENTGGSVIYTLPSASAVGNGFFVYIINAGTGNVTITPVGGQTIDGNSTKVLAPTETAMIFGDNANFHSLGYGRSIVNTVTGAAINVAGGPSTITLNSTQVAAQVQDYSGTLTGNQIVDYGGVIGYWFVFNNTTGAFNVTARSGGLDAGVVIPQGNFTILRSNGTNMKVAFTATTGTVTSVATTANLTGGPITSSGTLDLSDTTVTPGTYGVVGPPIVLPSITVDQKGRITGVTNITLGTSASLPASAAVGLADAGDALKLDANGLVPSINGGIQTGDLAWSFATSKPGFVFANSTTIGDGSSGASQRANADTVNLFTLLWNNLANGQAPVSGGRGGSAAADFAAHKTITIPDLRGTVPAGLDNAGGVGSAGRLSSIFASTTMGAAVSNGAVTSAGVSVTVSVGVGVTVGGSLTGGTGTEDNDLAGISTGGGSVGAAAPHTHPNVTVSGNLGGSGSGSGSGGGSTSAFGIAQSTMVMNPFIKL